MIGFFGSRWLLKSSFYQIKCFFRHIYGLNLPRFRLDSKNKRFALYYWHNEFVSQYSVGGLFKCQSLLVCRTLYTTNIVSVSQLLCFGWIFDIAVKRRNAERGKEVRRLEASKIREKGAKRERRNKERSAVCSWLLQVFRISKLKL